MCSFVKELDAETTRLARKLANNQEKLREQFRSLTLVIVWVGGDKDIMDAWAQKHGLLDLLIGVAPAGDETLEPWRLDPDAHNTTVILIRSTPKAKLIDLNAMEWPLLQEQIDKHFSRYK